MEPDGLARVVRDGVTLDAGHAAGVDFAFTERTGGVSKAPYASLNLGLHVGDDALSVAENRRRALAAMGIGHLADRLLTANQVHGDHVVTVERADGETLARAREELAAGADAVVCTAADVPVMLLYADCTPVVLVAPGGFAVVHSGWRGTYARISAKAVLALSCATGAPPERIEAFVGPHILGDEYEVSPELVERFALRFDNIRKSASNMLDMSAAIRLSLEEVGVPPCAIHDVQLSTMSLPERFFSYRGEGGVCGRHAAIAVRASEPLRRSR